MDESETKRVTFGSLREFVKRETVLCAALLLAGISCFVIPPDRGYLSYIDIRTLALLFSLMTVMAGLQRQGVFYSVGKFLLQRTRGLTQVILVLVLLCFFGSMIITNDVALITFVPLTFTVLDMLGQEFRKSWVLPIVCMQTIAANLGSMFTPIGNPQNLYLFGKSGIGVSAFLLLMLPYSVVSLLLLVGWAAALSRGKKTALPQVKWESGQTTAPDKRKMTVYAGLFLLCMVTVAHILPYEALFVILIAAVLCFDRGTLTRVDYSLLLTFAGFFIFIGNMGRVEALSLWLRTALAGHEVPIAILASQIISNVPAALLLSGFTAHMEPLIVGTNLGGLGTLIASMASLISYRQIAGSETKRKGEYFLMFTVSNLIFLAVLMLEWLALGGR